MRMFTASACDGSSDDFIGLQPERREIANTDIAAKQLVKALRVVGVRDPSFIFKTIPPDLGNSSRY